MAGAIQTEENVVAYWPPFVWRLLSGFTPSEAEYASGIDQSVATYAVRSCFHSTCAASRLAHTHTVELRVCLPASLYLQDIASCSADEFELQYEDIFTFEIQRSDGLLYSLDTPAGAGSGADVPVTLANRHDFVAAAVKVRRRFLAFCAHLW
eukprot:COSAG06_NODE_111_length_23480_cov_56.592703_7_plen_152_part_00